MGNDASKLQEKYHIQKVKLGEGSFGTVWRAIDKATDQVVAIKSVEKDRMRKRGVKPDDMAREIKMLFEARGCEYITELRDTFEDDNGHYLALEYCEGGDFGDKLKEKKESLEEYEACNWMRQILMAIQFLHDKLIVHRDIKPDNFMLSSHTKTAKLKLSDFGLAIRLPNQTYLLKDKCGTPAFMSPEQHELPRSSGYSFPIDIFAAGTCLWCILHGGEHPFMNGTQLDLGALLAGSPQFRGNSAFWTSSKWSPASQSFTNDLTARDYKTRPDATKALTYSWFSDWQSHINRNIFAGVIPPRSTTGNGSGAIAAASPNNPRSSDAGGPGARNSSGNGLSSSSNSNSIGHTTEINLRERNKELQAQIDALSRREADEKAAMAEKIKQLEAAQQLQGSGQQQQQVSNLNYNNVISGIANLNLGQNGNMNPGPSGAGPSSQQEPVLKRLSGGFGVAAGGLLQGLANAFSGAAAENSPKSGSGGGPKASTGGGNNNNNKNNEIDNDISSNSNSISKESIGGPGGLRGPGNSGPNGNNDISLIPSSDYKFDWDPNPGNYGIGQPETLGAVKTLLGQGQSSDKSAASDAGTAGYNRGPGLNLNFGGTGPTQSSVNRLTQENRNLMDERERVLQEARQKQQHIESLEAQLLKKNEATTSGGSGGNGNNASSKNVHNNSVRMLSDGQKVCYNSASHDAWFMGAVQSYNSQDGTYNLDLKQHAPPDRVSPPFERNADMAWPPGIYVSYWSESVKQWLKAVILGYNVDDGTYNLDVKQRATVDRMRIRNGVDVLQEERNLMQAGPGGASLPQNVSDQNNNQQIQNQNQMQDQVQQVQQPSSRYMGYDSLKGAGEVVGRLTNPFGGGGGVSNEQQGGSSGSGDNPNLRSSQGGGPPLTVSNNLSDPRAGQSQQQYLNWSEMPVVKRGSTTEVPQTDIQRFFSLSGVLKPGVFCSYRENETSSWRNACIDSLINEEYLFIRINVTYPSTAEQLQTHYASFQQRQQTQGPQIQYAANNNEGELIRVNPIQVGPPLGPYGLPPSSFLRWAPGTWVLYHSVSLDSWLPSTIQSYTEAGDNLINLANKPLADPERVRIRLKAEPVEKNAIEQKIIQMAAQQNHNSSDNLNVNGPGPGQGSDGQHQQMNCEKCGRVYWSLSGKTKLCPPCREIHAI